MGLTANAQLTLNTYLDIPTNTVQLREWTHTQLTDKRKKGKLIRKHILHFTIGISPHNSQKVINTVHKTITLIGLINAKVPKNKNGFTLPLWKRKINP
jgi:hypothetical protein